MFETFFFFLVYENFLDLFYSYLVFSPHYRVTEDYQPNNIRQVLLELLQPYNREKAALEYIRTCTGDDDKVAVMSHFTGHLTKFQQLCNGKGISNVIYTNARPSEEDPLHLRTVIDSFQNVSINY